MSVVVVVVVSVIVIVDMEQARARRLLEPEGRGWVGGKRGLMMRTGMYVRFI